jgi:hypothetical protein
MNIELSKLDYKNATSIPVTIEGIKHLSIKIPLKESSNESVYLKLIETNKKWRLLWATYSNGNENLHIKNSKEELNRVVLQFNKVLHEGFTTVIKIPKEKSDFHLPF